LGAFAREILPGLRRSTARELAEATGLSVGYCRTILNGDAVPHPMWWSVLAKAASSPKSR
jgi:hypothetical protein